MARVTVNERGVVEAVLAGLADYSPLAHLRRIEDKLDQITTNQKEERKRMANAQATIDRLVRENNESRAEIAETLTSVRAAVTLLQEIPDKIRSAVAEALAANPGVDLSAVEAVADDMDGQQGALDAAQQALDAAVAAAEAPTSVPEPEPVPGPAPVEPAPATEPSVITSPSEPALTEPSESSPDLPSESGNL